MQDMSNLNVIFSMASFTNVAKGIWTCYEIAEVGLGAYSIYQGIQSMLKSKEIQDFLRDHSDELKILEDLHQVLDCSYVSGDLSEALKELKMMSAQNCEMLSANMEKLRQFAINMTLKKGDHMFDPDKIAVAGAFEGIMMGIATIATMIQMGSLGQRAYKWATKKTPPADKFKRSVLNLMNRNGKKFALKVDPVTGKKTLQHVNLNPRKPGQSFSLADARRNVKIWKNQNFTVKGCLMGAFRTIRVVGFGLGIYMANKGRKDLKNLDQELTRLKQMYGSEGKFQKNEEDLMLALTLLICEVSNSLYETYFLIAEVQSFFQVIKTFDMSKAATYQEIIVRYYPQHFVEGFNWQFIETITAKSAEMSAQFNKVSKQMQQLKDKGLSQQYRRKLLQFLVFAKERMRQLQPDIHKPQEGKTKISVILAQIGNKIKSDIVHIQENMSSFIKKQTHYTNLLSKVALLPEMVEHEIEQWKHPQGEPDSDDSQETQAQLHKRLWVQVIKRTLQAIYEEYVLPFLGEEKPFTSGKEGQKYIKAIRKYLADRYPQYQRLAAQLLFAQFDKIPYDSEDGLSLFNNHKKDFLKSNEDALGTTVAFRQKPCVILLPKENPGGKGHMPSAKELLHILYKTVPAFNPENKQHRILNYDRCKLFIKLPKQISTWEVQKAPKRIFKECNQHKFFTAIIFETCKVGGNDMTSEVHVLADTSLDPNDEKWILDPPEFKKTEELLGSDEVKDNQDDQ